MFFILDNYLCVIVVIYGHPKTRFPRKISKVPGCGIQNTTAKTVEQCTSETEDKIGMDLQQLNLSYLDLVGVLVQDIASVELFGFGSP